MSGYEYTPLEGPVGMFTCKFHGHQDSTSEILTDLSRGMGYDEFVPECESEVSPGVVNRAAVPIQIGFVKLGGIWVKEGLSDSG